MGNKALEAEAEVVREAESIVALAASEKQATVEDESATPGTQRAWDAKAVLD